MIKRRTISGYIALLLLCCSVHAGAQPKEVKTGLYLMNLYDLNMDEHSFYADFYIWFKWKGNFDPTKIEFVNAIEKWSIDHATFDNDSLPVKLKDGYNYKIYRIEGRFFHSFALNRFPLDQHALDIQIENPEKPADSLIYVADTNAAAVRNTLNLVGWNQEGCKMITTVHDYGTNFGNPDENARKYSNITYFITLSRPISYFLLKMLLPLFVVMVVSIGALFLHPTHIDTRSSLPIGGLLTAVFLQQSYSSALPDTGYMVLMDKIYLLAYVLISLVLWQVIRSGNDLDDKIPKNTVIKREQRMAWLFVGVFAVGTLLLSIVQ